MGASVNAYWPGITREQIEESHPGFYNDDKAWGNWMANREEEPEVLEAIKRLNAEAILTFKTDGWDDEDVCWGPRKNSEMPQRGCVKPCRPGCLGLRSS